MEKRIRHADHGCVAALVDDNSKVLILGSMLSPKSVEASFYYAHPQNRFWRVIAALFNREYSLDNAERAQLALSNKLALWDVIRSCDIVGAADSTISNVEFNDVDGFLRAHPSVAQIFTTGGKAYKLLMQYNKLVSNDIIAKAIALPSTSPLNCAASLNSLVSAYSIIKKYV